MPHNTKEIKKSKLELRKEIRERTVGYIVAALGLVAGLAWNDAIKTLIEFFFPASGNTIFAKFFYAILLTVIIVFLTVQLLRLVQQEEE